MSEGDTAANPSEPATDQNETETKQTYRQKVWDYLIKNNLSLFPKPFGRIPNFKGSDEAAAKLLELDAFKESKNVEVSPDKPQEAARVLALENKKNLYVPVPRLKEGLLKHVTVPENAEKSQIKEAVSRRGLDNGTTITIGDKVTIDLFVLGSVAVSKEGFRIGKGKGYADLEYAILLEMGAVTENTVIVTIVHDSQVFDTLPGELFQPFDVPVDIIVTPAEIFHVQNKLPRPGGIMWKLISKRKLNLMPVLQLLKEQHESVGRETDLKEVDTDIEYYDPRLRDRRYRRNVLRRARSESKASQREAGTEENKKKPVRRYLRPRRYSRKRKVPRSDNSGPESGETEGESQPLKKPASDSSAKKPNRLRRSHHRKRFEIDFSVMVGNINKNVRVRDLKKALFENMIRPNEIIWHGARGFCYLHFAKMDMSNNRTPQEPVMVENVIDILANMKILPESETNLRVKLMQPISRIETTDVTAV